MKRVNDTTAMIKDLFSTEELRLIQARADREGVTVTLLVRVLVMGGLQSFKK